MKEPSRNVDPLRGGDHGNRPGHGLRAGFARSLGALSGYVAARCDLFAIEAGAAGRRLLMLLLFAAGGLLFLAVGYLMAAFAALFLLAQIFSLSPALVALLLGLLHLLGAAVFGIALARDREGLFKETINQFRKDREWLRSMGNRDGR